MAGKWKKRHFENQTTYTPPGGGVEFTVTSLAAWGGRYDKPFSVSWAKEGSVTLHHIGTVKTMKEAFNLIQKTYRDALDQAGDIF